MKEKIKESDENVNNVFATITLALSSSYWEMPQLSCNNEQNNNMYETEISYKGDDR